MCQHKELQDKMREHNGYLEVHKKTINGLPVTLRSATDQGNKVLTEFFESLSADSMINRLTISSADITSTGIRTTTHFDPSIEMEILAEGYSRGTSQEMDDCRSFIDTEL